MLTFRVKVLLVAGHDHCPAAHQADSRQQRDKIDNKRKTANHADRRRRVESRGFVFRGRSINLVFHHVEDRVHSPAVYSVRYGRRIVSIDG